MNRITPTKLLARFVITAVLAASAAGAVAEYPERPIRLVIPFPAGGASDQTARAFGESLSKRLGQPIVFDNKAGANGLIAAQLVYTSAADGYTLLWGVASMSGAPMLQRDAPFRSMTEFIPIVLVGRLSTGLLVHPDVPARTLTELVRYAQANPDAVNFASANYGEQMTTWRFLKEANVSMTRIPYKGGVQAITDLIGGRVQVYITPLAPTLPHVQAGKLRLLATVGERSQIAPEVPTFAEAGYPGVSFPSWQAVFGPPKMPAAIAERIARESVAVIADAGVRAQIERLSVTPGGQTLLALAAIVRDEERQWQAFVKVNGIVPE